MDEKDTEAMRRMEKIVSALGEHFSEYVVITKLPSGMTGTKFSDCNWTYGVLSRTLRDMETCDFSAMQEFMQDE